MATINAHWRPLLIPLALVLLGACNRPAATPTIEPGAGLVYTAAAQTLEAQLTESASGVQPTATPVPPQPTSPPAPTDAPTAAPVSTDAPTATAGPTQLPCDRASFVRDVSIPDGTEFLAGASFEKTWRLKNNGSCTWDSSYSLIFDSGAAMGGPAASPLSTGSVAPGQELDVTVRLTAPLDPGTYRGNWRLRNADGVSFGLGPQGDAVFWVEIVVNPPTPTPNPAFSLAYETTHNCDGNPTVILKIDNTGNVALESLELTLRDVDNNANLHGPATTNAPFMGQPGECPPGGDRVPAGTTRYVGAGVSTMPPAGTNLRATVKLCTQNELAGSCVEKTVDFAAP